jgi:hypothetical protein
MFEELRNVVTQHPINYEAVMHRPTPASREVTLSSDKKASFDDAARCVQDSIRGGNKRCKKRPLGTTTTSSHDDDRGWEAGSSGMGCVTTATRGGRHLTRMPLDHFKRFLEEACPNHTCPVRHKLKDCGMMQSFMTSGSLTWGADPDEGPHGSDATPFPKENTIMTVLEGRLLFGGTACPA